MNHKKILAREFLYLLGSIILFLIIYGIWSWKYSAIKDKYGDTENILTEMIETDDVSYRVKVFHYLNQDYPEFKEKYKNINDFVFSISKDEVSEFWYNKLDERGLVQFDINYFRSKIKDDTTFSEQSKKYQKLKARYDNSHNSIFSDYPKDLYIGYIIFILFFGLRYLIYSIKWSLNQLQK
ncbi:hypothetical protein OAJ14_05580 [Polaribacter sp.]|jgi:hypothetical protein|nr:hypothetical protein [Polaribacter sp.]